MAVASIITCCIGDDSADSAISVTGLLLFVDSFINRCYLLVSGSVRVSITAEAMVTPRRKRSHYAFYTCPSSKHTVSVQDSC